MIPKSLGTRARRWIPPSATAALVLLFTVAADSVIPRDRLPGSPPFLTVFMIDGLSQRVFEEELAANRLPNMRQLVDEGVYVRNGISSFPSMTAYGFYPFLTGVDAVESGILGLRWFDRERSAGNVRSYVGMTNVLLNRDLVERPLTLYELFADQHSMSLNTYANRGVARDVKLGRAFAMAKYQDHHSLVGTMAALPIVGRTLAPSWEDAETTGVIIAIADLEHRPKVQWLTFTSTDGVQHVEGTTERYRELVRHVDGLIGDYRGAAERLGIEERRIYALITDHGVADVRSNMDLRDTLSKCCELVAEQDESTHLWSSKLERPLAELDAVDVQVVINGNMSSYLYFRGPKRTGGDGWRERLFFEDLSSYRRRDGTEVDLVAALRRTPGIELVLARSQDGSTRVSSASGEATIRETDEGLSYTVVGSDPFGYSSDARARSLVGGQPHPERLWLDATQSTHYPDAVYRTARLMAAEATGDVVLTAAVGHDFGLDYEMVVKSYRGGHGGLRADQLRVPYVIAGPGIRAGTELDVARAEDVGVLLRMVLGSKSHPEGASTLWRKALTPKP